MPRVARDSCLPTSHVFITSKHPDLAPCPPSSQSHHHPPGRGLVGWAGVGFPVYTIPTPGINSCWFCFYFNFFCFDFFLNKNFHFKHIYTEGICAVYWGELDPELGVRVLGEGRGSQGLLLSRPLLTPPSPPPPFLLPFLLKTVKCSLPEAQRPSSMPLPPLPNH